MSEHDRIFIGKNGDVIWKRDGEYSIWYLRPLLKCLADAGALCAAFELNGEDYFWWPGCGWSAR